MTPFQNQPKWLHSLRACQQFVWTSKTLNQRKKIIREFSRFWNSPRPVGRSKFHWEGAKKKLHWGFIKFVTRDVQTVNQISTNLTRFFFNIFLRNSFALLIFSIVGFIFIFVSCVYLPQLRFSVRFTWNSLRGFKHFFQLTIRFGFRQSFPFSQLLSTSRKILDMLIAKREVFELSLILFSSEKVARSVSGWYSQYHDLTGVNFWIQSL